MPSSDSSSSPSSSSPSTPVEAPKSIGFNIPSEYRLSLKWENAIEKFSYNMMGGALIAGIAGIVLFRNRNPRLIFATFGAGFGAGDAYRLTTIDFEKDKKNSGKQ